MLRGRVGPVRLPLQQDLHQFRGQELGGCDKTELPVNHLAGTCRLASSISEGVADLRLRVHGVSGLRIADASVMPFPPSGNTHATCMMIGERASMVKVPPLVVPQLR